MTWTASQTNAHQDGVIAHVIGASVLGHFICDETAYLLLDIGFIWNIYLDGEMGLLPHPVVIGELDVAETIKTELRADIDLLLQGNRTRPARITAVAAQSPILAVDIFERANSRRLLLTCEQGTIAVETSLDSGEVKILSENE